MPDCTFRDCGDPAEADDRCELHHGLICEICNKRSATRDDAFRVVVVCDSCGEQTDDDMRRFERKRWTVDRETAERIADRLENPREPNEALRKLLGKDGA